MIFVFSSIFNKKEQQKYLYIHKLSKLIRKSLSTRLIFIISTNGGLKEELGAFIFQSLNCENHT